MEITLDLPESTLRRIRALNVLVGGNPRNIDQIVSHLIEKAATTEIMEHLNGDAPLKLTQADYTPSNAEPEIAHEMGISASLGDEDTTPEDEEDEITKGLKEAEALVPDSGGLTDQEMDADMAVEDPSSEAKSDASGVKPNSAEDLFASKLHFGDETASEVDHRIAKRRKRSKSKGKVRPLGSNESAT